MSGHVILDLSRLLWRAARFAPTGIDRVELAYARQLIASMPDRLSFAGWWGRMSLLPQQEAIQLVAALDLLWSGGVIDEEVQARVRHLTKTLRAHALWQGERPLQVHVRGLSGGATYLSVSHYRLHHPGPLRRLKRHAHLRFVFLVHDLIPIQLPQHVPPGHDRRHRRRMETVMRLADHVIANSAGTAAALERIRQSCGARVPITVAHLGLDLRKPASFGPLVEVRPYFVCLSTIEPRKNHKLLLRVWQRLAAQGDEAPRLVLLGRRGWRSGTILRKARRLRGLVELHENLPDHCVADYLHSARALLNPSFAEGFGLPIAEALAMGVPVLCSDLPELREVGRQAPEFLSPYNDEVWYRAIADYALSGSDRRARQLERISQWRPFGWDEHFAITMPLLE
jgi:glycosyltransferase involved in cell wall biosynthesis